MFCEGCRPWISGDIFKSPWFELQFSGFVWCYGNGKWLVSQGFDCSILAAQLVNRLQRPTVALYILYDNTLTTTNANQGRALDTDEPRDDVKQSQDLLG
jgi:hypothetical protein